jgi:hypothetical protein
MPKLYLVLTRSPSPLSLLVHLIKGDNYTHAALAFDKDLNYMFSFGARRFYNPFVTCCKRETFDRDLYRFCAEVSGMVMEVPVTQTQYDLALQVFKDFLLDSHLYRVLPT